MRIAQVAPLYESVPPELYGGTERIVSYLTESLVREGHHVTLFASGHSRTHARLVPGSARPLRLASPFDPLAYHVAQLRHVMDRASEFDVIHNHMDYLGFTLAVASRTPVITTLHGRLDLPDLPALFTTYADVDLISISDAQRAPLPAARWRGTVHHGLPGDLYRPGTGAGDYLAFLGRISPEKRLDSAIRIARRAGVPLRVAAKIDPADVEYFESEIRPLLDDPDIEFIGELGESDKQRFLGEARALLFPIDWPEPFGLVMIEALACGTPVIALRRGSVPEVIAHGVTGFVCDDENAMAEAVRRLDTIERGNCRHAFETRFTAARMTRDYVRLYEALLTDSARGAA